MTDDDLRILVIEGLHAGDGGYRHVVRDIARAQGDMAAHRLEAALLWAARELDAAIRQSGAPTDEARTARRLALLLGMDIDRLSDGTAAGPTPMPGQPVTLGQLVGFWTDNDDFFLRL